MQLAITELLRRRMQLRIRGVADANSGQLGLLDFP